MNGPKKFLLSGVATSSFHPLFMFFSTSQQSYMPTKAISANFMAFISLALLVGIVKALSARHSKENLGYLYDYTSDDFSTFALRPVRRQALWASILSQSLHDAYEIYRQGCESLAQSHYFYVYYARRTLLSCRSIKSDGIR